MFDRLKQWLHKEEFTKETVNKPVIITIHGYGRRCKHEFDNLALWGKKDGYDIIQFDMYDIFDEQDHDWMRWIAKTKDILHQNQNREIYLVGFSMGGVIASYLAATNNIHKLILLAPAFSYMNLDTIAGVISKSYSSLMKPNNKTDTIELPRSFYVAFMDLVKNLKKYIQQVPCPVLIMHGDVDEVIATRSSIQAYNNIPHERKKLVILHGGHHRLFMDESVNWECYQIIKLFFDDHILHDQKIEQAPDIMNTLMKRYQALHPVVDHEEHSET